VVRPAIGALPRSATLIVIDLQRAIDDPAAVLAALP
jgi:hypothetical protein